MYGNTSFTKECIPIEIIKTNTIVIIDDTNVINTLDVHDKYISK